MRRFARAAAVALLVASPAAAQRPVLLRDTLSGAFPRQAVDVVGRRHVLAGLGAGATIASVSTTIALSPYAQCTGSGDYLQTCRLVFTGAVVVGAGLGSLVGALIRTERPIARPLDARQFDGLLGDLAPGQPVRARFEDGGGGDSRVRASQDGTLALGFGNALVALRLATLDSLWVRTDRRRTTGALVGMAAATIGVFVASVALCEQESSANPDVLCGDSGFPRVASVVGGGALGAALGATLGFPPRSWRLRYARGTR